MIKYIAIEMWINLNYKILFLGYILTFKFYMINKIRNINIVAFYPY